MIQLSGQDASFLYMESGDNLTHVTSVNIYDPSTVPGGKKVRFKDIIEHMRARLPMNPFLKRKLVRVPLELDYPYWADDQHFDLEAHIHHSRLPQPADWRQFCIHVARYHSRPLDMNRPAWEMYVIEGLNGIDGVPKGAYAIATKIHHAAADGAALSRFFGTLLDIDNKGTPCLSLDHTKIKPTKMPTAAQMARRAVRNNLTSPIKFLGAVRRSAPVIYKTVQNLVNSARSKEKNAVPLTRFNVPIEPHKMFDAVDFQLADFKALRALAPGSTINDVVLTVIAGALRLYLNHHKELPADPLYAYMPVDARPSSADDEGKLGNNLDSMITPIYTQVADPAERMQKIVVKTQASKQQRAATAGVDMSALAEQIPNSTQILASRLILRSTGSFRASNLFVSNVPGSPVPNYMLGAKVLRTYGLAPLNDGMGLFISTPSYLDKMTFGVISTRSIMPDISFFIECLQQSMAEALVALQQHTQGAANNKESKKRKAAKKVVSKAVKNSPTKKVTKKTKNKKVTKKKTKKTAKKISAKKTATSN